MEREVEKKKIKNEIFKKEKEKEEMSLETILMLLGAMGLGYILRAIHKR